MRTMLVGLLLCLYGFGLPAVAIEDTTPQSIFKQKCSHCHKLPEPGKRTFSEWQLVLDVMQQVMLSRNVSVLNDTEKEQVLIYLKQNARPSASEPVSLAEEIFSARCTLCHQLPEPSMLKPKQWALMMTVMQQRMMQAGVPQLDKQEYELVQGYLKERARQ